MSAPEAASDAEIGAPTGIADVANMPDCISIHPESSLETDDEGVAAPSSQHNCDGDSPQLPSSQYNCDGDSKEEEVVKAAMVPFSSESHPR